MIPEPLLRLAINRFDVLRPNEKCLVEDLVDSEELFRALTPALLSQMVGRQVGARRADRDAASASGRAHPAADELLRLAEKDLAFLRSHGIHAISQADRRYPATLREIYDPPYLLYVRGELPGGDTPSVAVVGTRRPTAAAAIAAERLGADLAAAGVTVVSGLALGIDVAAHRGALAHGTTGAILASGVDVVSPSSHRGVARAILDAGGYLATEYAPGVPPVKYHFPARNRIISGLSRGVVIVQAPARSGALITADYALDHGRDLFVHRAGLEPPEGAGSADLAADGALIVDGAPDVLGEWGVFLPARAGEPARADGATEPRSAGDAAAARVAAMRATVLGEAAV